MGAEELDGLGPLPETVRATKPIMEVVTTVQDERGETTVI